MSAVNKPPNLVVSVGMIVLVEFYEVGCSALFFVVHKTCTIQIYVRSDAIAARSSPLLKFDNVEGANADTVVVGRAS